MNNLKLNSTLKKLSARYSNDHDLGANVRLKFNDFDIVKNTSNDFDLGKKIRAVLRK